MLMTLETFLWRSFWILFSLLILIGCCVAPGCTNTGPTNIPANVTLHVDTLNITLTMPPGSIVIPPGAVSVPINVTINGKLLTPSPASQPASASSGQGAGGGK